MRPFNPEFLYFKNLYIEDFKNQLDYFQDEYGFVSKQDFLDCFETNELPKGVILTFDDGLSCHYNYVFPELKKRKLWGIFYVPTYPFFENKILDVHRAHLLLGKYNAYDLYCHLQEIVNDTMIDSSKFQEFKQFTYTSQINDEHTLNFKRMINYFIDYRFKTKIMDDLMGKFFPDESDLCKEFYMSEEQIREMHNENMIIGSHTVNHPVMSRLSKENQEYEIGKSFEFLNKITGSLHHSTFCYPYGGFHSFNKETEILLKNYGCKYSFNVEHRDIELNDLTERPQALPRYDCNQFKYGQVRN